MTCFHDAPAAVYNADYMRCLDFRRLVGLQQHGTGINGVKALFSNRSDDCAKKLPSSKREQCALTQTRRQVRTKSKMEKRNCLRKNQYLIGYCLTGWSKNAYHSCALKDACHCHTRGQYASHDQTRKLPTCTASSPVKYNYSSSLGSRCGKDG